MLLRQEEPANVDGYISAAAAAAMNSPREDEQHQQHHPQDTSTSATSTTVPRTDPLDDVFGSEDGDDDTPVFEDAYDGDHDSNPPHIRPVAASPAHHHHPSDMHRLRQEHTTAGYRDGITAAKARSVQAGFDEGFGLGATVGLRVGYLLGVLEGVAAAVALLGRDGGPEESEGLITAAEDRAEALNLLAEARAELALQVVFGPEYWEADGTWRYEIGSGKAGEEEESVVLFSHVAEAHPLVRKWTLVVEGQMRRWGVEGQLALLRRRDDDHDVDEDDARAAGVVRGVKAVAPSQADAKVANGALSW
ncbi:hypothetical protein DHEL01_v200029 [Diaporthe helianthi]|uniref:Protein YAE1 n=1 Tax=Diaporthe helianthi TaxID=158607 RepID=A0A2P5IGI6_DIAHE|nr:hypothetical protein DHEL01_v200029 [Diaporthe helianthi]